MNDLTPEELEAIKRRMAERLATVNARDEARAVGLLGVMDRMGVVVPGNLDGVEVMK